MSGISLLTSYLANAVWQVTAVATAGWIAACVLKRMGPRAEHIGWVSTLAVAVLAPAASLFRSLPTFVLSQPSNGGGLSLIFADVPEVLQHQSGLYQWPTAAIWTVAALYIATTFYFAYRTVLSLFRVRALIASAAPQPLTAEQEEIWSRCRRLFALRGVRLLSSSEISGPVVAGVRKPILIVPAEFTSRCDGSDLLAALAHECAHAERRDFQKNLCYEAIGIALAFHPAIWFIKARIAQTREMICDSMVAERVLEPRSYAHALLRLAAMVTNTPRAAAVHAIGIFDANILEKRVMMISRERRYAGRVMRSGLTTFACLLLASAGMFAAAKAIVIEPQSASADQSGRIYKVGDGVTAPVAIFTPVAKFSDEARRHKYQGVVLISMIVDAQGNPQNPRVIRPLGMGLDKKALEAVRKYKFKPAMKDGKTPVPVMVTVEVNFKLY